ncbi:restriction endonuclease subunit S [Paenactinomyces guangxiensis]|uniref:Restriction endonuclease subunit S n=1 Tax=Paenactinomyces guangxiensis TaxID=1490290 RepID=A0A7W2AAP0_9BACL|nr:restriction endonuclease subunit S [Paenactinomyces guangxiensis]MBA4496399.1 restriction endonuclease subunit S [Paenactinomyces guangxiensis]MBH8593470.1 restriction endonuclease subunit S [Paenactinomyces guangxiensis]
MSEIVGPLKWRLSFLEDVLEKIIGGGTPSRKVEEYYTGNISWVTVKDLVHHKISSSQEYITEKAIQNSATNLIPKGNVIIATRMAVGKAFINEVDVAINQDLKALIPNKNIIETKFLLYFLMNKSEEIEKMGTGTTVKGIRLEQLKKIRINVPSLPEQRKIAAILTSVDDAIEKTEAIIKQTEKAKKGLMQQLLTKGIGHTEFKQTEIGEIPEAWGVELLDNVATRKSGHTPNKKINNYWNGSIPWISLKDTQKLDNRYIRETTDYTTNAGIKNSSAVLLPAGTVVISRDATVGKVGIMGVKMATSQHFINYICGQTIDSRFLYYYLLSCRSIFKRIAAGNTIKTIGLPFFKEFKIALPPINEQRQISKILWAVDDRIEYEKKYLEQLGVLKKALMQSLLTGKVRVKVDENAEVTA